MAPRTEAPTEALKLRDDELFITRTFDAPLSVVWRMWQDREHMIRWWGPEGFTVTDLEHDFRPGGAWRVGMTWDAHPKGWSGGKFIEIEPMRRIVLSFAWEDGSGGPTETTITVQFEERAGRTTQHFHQTPFPTAEYRDGHVVGWNSLFNKEEQYAAALAKGIQLPQLT